MPTSLRNDLIARLLEHCGWMCETGEEGPIADAVERRYRDRGEHVQRIGHSLVVGGPPAVTGQAPPAAGAPRPLVLLVGHLDVVAPTDADRLPRVEQDPTHGEVVVARGTSDMKAGNVIAMRAFEDPVLRAASPYELVLVLYAGEEGAADTNELADVLTAVPWLADASLAIVLEPTDGQVQLGCLGGLHALVTFHGRQAHSARPWQGDNAITKAAALLAALRDDHVRDVEVEGIAYRDVWSVTQAYSTGFGPDDPPLRFRNIIPDRFTLNLNLRFAPHRDLAAAEAELRARVGDDAEVVVIDRAPPAPPHRNHPLVAAFVAAVDAEVEGKQAWTDVARFTGIGVPALNYGPGLTAQAHQRGELVPIDAVVTGFERLAAFLAGPGAPTDATPGADPAQDGSPR